MQRCKVYIRYMCPFCKKINLVRVYGSVAKCTKCFFPVELTSGSNYSFARIFWNEKMLEARKIKMEV